MEYSGVMRVAHCEGCKKGQLQWKDSMVESPASNKMILIADTPQRHASIGSFNYVRQPNQQLSKLRIFTSLNEHDVQFVEEPDTKYHWIYRDDLKAE